MIRVLITDDHALVRDGLRRMLSASDAIDVVGEAASGAEALQMIPALAPDVVLLDISMPGKDGIETAAAVTALGVGTKVLMLTMHEDHHHALRAFRAGASGFVGKAARFDQLVHAICEVHAGNRYAPPELEDAAAKADDHTVVLPGDNLSRREFQVMCFLASGLTNREIAERLAISVKTVDTHRGHVLKKLKLRNNSDVTRFAIQNGYVRV